MISTIASKVHWSDSKGHGGSQSGQYRLLWVVKKSTSSWCAQKANATPENHPEVFIQYLTAINVQYGSKSLTYAEDTAIWEIARMRCESPWSARDLVSTSDLPIIIKNLLLNHSLRDYQEYPLHPTNRNRRASTFARPAFERNSIKPVWNATLDKFNMRPNVSGGRDFEVRPKAHASLASQP
jgi:hypothetical protein